MHARLGARAVVIVVVAGCSPRSEPIAAESARPVITLPPPPPSVSPSTVSPPRDEGSRCNFTPEQLASTKACRDNRDAGKCEQAGGTWRSGSGVLSPHCDCTLPGDCWCASSRDCGIGTCVLSTRERGVCKTGDHGRCVATFRGCGCIYGPNDEVMDGICVD